MVNKIYCMSSYLAFRYIENININFYENMQHEHIKPIDDNLKKEVKTANDIDFYLNEQIKPLLNKKIGLLLSGGMDSAILASYLSGCEAYTFRFLNGDYQKEELNRAEFYAKKYNLNLHYIDINYDVVDQTLDLIMQNKCAPVHSIEPQIYKAAIEAKKDNVELMFVGESADLIFGGMDQLLSKDWTYDEFKNRYTFTKPEDVLVEYEDMSYLFDRYKLQNNKIDFLSFMDNVFSIESSSSYFNAFKTANLDYFDPYAVLKMVDKLDLTRVRNGESKYLIRELFSKKYPEIKVPNKIPMPRPVDFYFENWDGPKRKEFKSNLDMKKFTGNQKWQLYCLERFLNNYEK